MQFPLLYVLTLAIIVSIIYLAWTFVRDIVNLLIRFWRWLYAKYSKGEEYENDV